MQFSKKDGIQMRHNPLLSISAINLALALICLVILALPPVPVTIRIISASVCVTTIVIAAIVYYVYKKGMHSGK